MERCRVTCCLGPDSVGRVLSAAVASARSRVVAGLYELGPGHVWPFLDAIGAGASVKVLLDRRPLGNDEAARALLAAGAEVRMDELPHAYLHWKVAVLDDTGFALGSGNLIETDTPFRRGGHGPFAGTREWWVVVHGAPSQAPAFAQHVETAFDRAGAPLAVMGEAAATPADVGTPDPQVDPADFDVDTAALDAAVGGAAAHRQLNETISGAAHRLWVTVPYIFTSGGHAAALLDAIVERGLADTRILLGQAPHPADLAALRGRGLDVRVMDVERSTRGHAKGLIADEAVVVGSANWSEPGLSANQEASVLIGDAQVTGYFAAAFDRDWAVAQA